ncbi:hypothetical protein Scep_023535 [Stephania cephalantha]|uniref:C2H2-type domain-containing protein n=1 Tax=Stephania cephalantha TaxID=152367 RepID=A0AAP0EUW0_9MAGN
MESAFHSKTVGMVDDIRLAKDKAGISTDLLLKTLVEIKEQQPDAHLKAIEVDLSSFQSILKFKNSLSQWLVDADMHPSIQLLINNAGILETSARLTNEGYERMTGTNYIGPFLLSNLLLPLLKSSSIPSRIVNITSFTHRCVSNLQPGEEILVEKYPAGWKQFPFACTYECSKFFILLFSYQLHQRLFLGDKSHRVSVIAADPGVVHTNIMREVPLPLSLLATTVLKYFGLLQSPEEGVESIIDAALAPPGVSGVYFFGGRGRTINSSALSYDARLRDKLWSDSCKLFVNSKLGFT